MSLRNPICKCLYVDSRCDGKDSMPYPKTLFKEDSFFMANMCGTSCRTAVFHFPNVDMYGNKNEPGETQRYCVKAPP